MTEVAARDWTDLSRATGVPASVLADWHRRDGMPLDDDSAELARWAVIRVHVLLQRLASAKSRQTGADTSRRDPRERLAEYRAANERLKFRRASGEVVSRAESMASMMGFASAVVAELERIPGELSARLLSASPGGMREAITEHIADVRRRLAEQVVASSAKAS